MGIKSQTQIETHVQISSIASELERELQVERRWDSQSVVLCCMHLVTRSRLSCESYMRMAVAG